jgi:hypothetical protein
MTSEQPLIGPPNTRIYADGNNTIVRFRDREIVRIAYLDVRLDAGGARDLVLQNRLNQASRLFDLGYHIVRCEGFGIVQTHYDHYVFQDGMHLRRSRDGTHEVIRYEANPAG